MTPRLLPSLLFAGLLISAGPALAQLPAPNAAGISAGHDIFTVRDLAAANQFWTTLGGTPAQLGPLKLMKFPGVLFLMRQGDPKGGTEGSSVEYIGFKVKNLKESLAKWQAAGIKPIPGATRSQAFLMGPDGVKVRITEDRSLTTPIAGDMLKMDVANVAEAQAWYAKWFGAKLVKRDKETVGEIPGSNLLFSAAKGTVSGTKGRAFDRIGLEVRGLEDFCKRLDSGGIKVETPYRKAKNMNLAVCLLTDPWGTYIELSEGLAAVK